MTQGYIFDYGATLDNPGNHWGMVIWHGYEHLGIPVTEEQYRDAYVYGERTLGSNDIIKPADTFLTTLKVKIDLQFDKLAEMKAWNPELVVRRKMHDELVDYLYGNLQNNIRHSREVLTQLKNKGCVIALVSNFYGNVEAVLAEMKLDNFFVKVIESAQVGIRKPDPRIYALGVEAVQQYAREMLHKEIPAEDITVVGDSIKKDIIPAKTLGCKSVWIKGEGWSKDVSDSDVPDLTITDLKELL